MTHRSAAHLPAHQSRIRPLRSLVTIAALGAATLPVASAAAQSIQGYAASATRLHAGPLRDFPGLRTVRRGTKIAVHGCLRDWTWCDVTSGSDRGWIAGNALRVVHKGRRRAVSNGLGISVTTFSFGSYWDDHYPGRRFYVERQRWRVQSDRAYRPEWGERKQQEGPGDDTRDMEEQRRRSRELGERTGGPIVPQYIGKPYRFPDRGTGTTTTDKPKSAGPAPDPD